MTASTAPGHPQPGASPPGQPVAKQLTARGATVLGIGSMIGAGIFALLGEAGAVAGAAVWISFLAGGIVAGLLGYVCAKLGMRFPSAGGLITYLIEGFGKGRLVGVACWLGYIAAIVIVGAMVAVSFGGYATSLFVGEHASGGWDNLFTTLVILGMLAVNLVGARFVANAQSLIVAVVLAVFAVFIVVTIVNINPHLLAFSSYPSFSKILASVALTFFAYLGFNVITFTAGDLRDPTHDLPRAMTYALGITALVYVLIAVGVFGTLTTDQVIGYGETAIAEAARPSLGDAGFTSMAIVALWPRQVAPMPRSTHRGT
jgi:amino acid transporter